MKVEIIFFHFFFSQFMEKASFPFRDRERGVFPFLRLLLLFYDEATSEGDARE